MFQNIGRKIQWLAIIFAIIGFVASVAGAIVCWVTFKNAIWLGFIVLLCGCLVFLIVAIMIYGFGELIVQTTIAANGIQVLKTQSTKWIQSSQTKAAPKNPEAPKIVNKNIPAFQIDNGMLKKYNGREAEVRIPEGVTSIGGLAFSGCSGITSITIPDSVTSIGNGAFTRCSGITSITIPNSVTSIGRGAFSGCAGLNSVTISEGVSAIEESTFLRCQSLTSITIPKGITFIGKYAFDECESMETVFFAEPSGWERNGVPIDENVLRNPRSAAEFMKKIGEGAIARKQR